jgi:glutamyl-tRNA synthetase
MTTIRTRFAPSPTGYLHVGGARTALYAYLYAKHFGGQFILRVEDTDAERSTEEAVQAILEGMQWLQLQYDEGPFYQTKRFDRYRELANKLLNENKAYRCYCTKERLEALRHEQTLHKEKPRYDGLCRQLKEVQQNVPYVVRFANPLSGEVVFDDAVHGKTVFQNQELDDLIILRSDGSPTYNFCVVADDADMKITHVIRGDDHLNNTPRQINILNALEAPLPVYAHIPMILGSDGKRFSKRHGAVSVMQFREEGFLPHALLNYLVRLGWSHGDQEIFSLKEMIDLFDINAVNKAAAAFDPQKLLWLNQHYLKAEISADVLQEFEWHLKKQGIDFSQGPSVSMVFEIQRERAKTLKEMAEKSRFFYETIFPPQALQEKFLTTQVKPALKLLSESLATLKTTEWSDEKIHGIIQEIAVKSDLKLGDLAQPVRVILSGGMVSPPLNSTIRVLGAEKVLRRLADFC